MTNKDDLALAYDKLQTARVAYDDAIRGYALTYATAAIAKQAWWVQVEQAREQVDDALEDLAGKVADYLDLKG